MGGFSPYFTQTLSQKPTKNCGEHRQRWAHTAKRKSSSRAILRGNCLIQAAGKTSSAKERAMYNTPSMSLPTMILHIGRETCWCVRIRGWRCQLRVAALHLLLAALPLALAKSAPMIFKSFLLRSLF